MSKYLMNKQEIERYSEWVLARKIRVIFNKKHEKFSAWAVPFILMQQKENMFNECLNLLYKEKVLDKKQLAKIDRDTIIVLGGEIKKSCVWHECGHLEDYTGESVCDNEYRAHMWAFKEAHRRKLKGIVWELAHDMEEWKNKSYVATRRKIYQNMPDEIMDVIVCENLKRK